MATAPQATQEMPQQGANPFADPNTMAVYEQMRQTVSPKEFGDQMLAGAEQAAPEEVAAFRSALEQIEMPPEALDLLNNMVDEILANPEQYDQIRAKYKKRGAPDEILPEQFDAQFFAALNMAVDQMIGEPSGVQSFAKGGIAELTPVAKAIASYGRNGDTMLAHITPAEARMLRRKGGSGTINPVTGLPEFFLDFIGKAFKAIGKAVKSFVNSTVGRIVTTVALGFFLGPAAASFLGATSTAAVAAVSGFVGSAGSTLLGGGNISQALKAGAMGGLTAGIGAGVMGGADAFAAGSYTGPTTIGGQFDKFTGAISGTPAPMADVTTNTARDAARTAEFAKMPEASAPVQASTTAPLTAPSAAPLSVPTADAFAPTSSQFGAFGEAPLSNTAMGTVAPPVNASAATAATGNAVAPAINTQPVAMPTAATGNVIAPGIGNAADATQFPGSFDKTGIMSNQQPGFFDSAKDFYNKNISPSGIQQEAAGNAISTVQKTFPTATAEQIMNAPPGSALAKAYSSAMPGIFSTYGPMTALGIGAIGAFGGFSPKAAPVSPFQDMLTGGPGSARDLMSKNPNRFYVQNLPGVNYYGGSVIKPTGMAQGGLADIAKMGRDGDTMLAHINPAEAQMLKRMGGRGTINPNTGLPEFAFRDDDFMMVSQDYGGDFDSNYDFGQNDNSIFDYDRTGATPDGLYIDPTTDNVPEITIIGDKPQAPVINWGDLLISPGDILTPVISDGGGGGDDIPEVTIIGDRPPQPPVQPPIVLPPVIPELPPIEPEVPEIVITDDRPPKPPVKPTCPAPEMRILLANGDLKAAGELQVGDVVKTQHENTLAWGEHPVTHVSLVPDASRLKFTFDDGKFVCSLDHKFFKAANEWVTAKDVIPGDMLSGKTVRSIEQTSVGDVVRITIDNAHTYICEGLLSHNKSPLPPDVPEIVITDDRPPKPPPEPPIVLPPVVPPLPPIKPTCPAPNMRILLADGSLKAAGDLQVGDVIRTQHETTLAWGDHPVTHVSIVPDVPRLKIELGDIEFVCSLDHKFFKAANEWVTAKDVVLGDMLNGHVVRSLTQADVGDVVRITVDDAHTYICEGLLSHNKSPLPPDEPPVVLPPVLPPVVITPPYVPPVVEPPYVPPTVPKVPVVPIGNASTDPRVAGVPGGSYMFTRNTPNFPTGSLSRTMSPYTGGITGLMPNIGVPPQALPAVAGVSPVPPQNPTQMNMGGIAGLAQGGYPRRTGQIDGPGTATSDSIPAMLSDGEFVMTAKAVRGAGKGDRRAGAKRMYALMNQLEKNAARG
jgi:hypothetical protein